MTKITDFIKTLTLKERGELLRELSKKVKKTEIKRTITKIKIISKRSLSESVREGLTDKQLAEKYNVSERTISRRIKEYKLKGLRSPGRTSLHPEWITTKEYIDETKKVYKSIVSVVTPKKKYINRGDLVCSNKKSYPNGKYSAVSVYFIVNYNGLRQIFVRLISAKKNLPFNEIKSWIIRNGYEILNKMFRKDTSFWVEGIIAYEFANKKDIEKIPLKYRSDIKGE